MDQYIGDLLAGYCEAPLDACCEDQQARIILMQLKSLLEGCLPDAVSDARKGFDQLRDVIDAWFNGQLVGVAKPCKDVGFYRAVCRNLEKLLHWPVHQERDEETQTYFQFLLVQVAFREALSEYNEIARAMFMGEGLSPVLLLEIKVRVWRLFAVFYPLVHMKMIDCIEDELRAKRYTQEQYQSFQDVGFLKSEGSCQSADTDKDGLTPPTMAAWAFLILVLIDKMQWSISGTLAHYRAAESSNRCLKFIPPEQLEGALLYFFNWSEIEQDVQKTLSQESKDKISRNFTRLHGPLPHLQLDKWIHKVMPDIWQRYQEKEAEKAKKTVKPACHQTQKKAEASENSTTTPTKHLPGNRFGIGTLVYKLTSFVVGSIRALLLAIRSVSDIPHID